MLILWSAWLLSNPLFSFPQNVRFGYPTCASCHVNPNGGGVLTPYGRSTLAEAMTTWSYDGEENLLYGLFKPSKRIDVGADARYLVLPDQRFFMQREFEVALNWSRYIYGVASSGTYGPLDTPDSRRYYLMATDQKNFWVKAGRFFPNYGIMSNEHYMLYRGKNFNQGQETWNVEGIYRNSWLELSAAKILGHPDDQKYGTKTDGFTGRILITPPKWKLTTGISFLGLFDELGYLQAYPAFSAIWAPYKQLWFETQAGEEDAFFRIGIEPYRGFSIKPQVEHTYMDEHPKYSVVLEWLPRPHFDLQAIFESQRYIFMYHFYI